MNDAVERKRSKTKAAAVEHAIRHHIDINIDDDPELYASFAEALEQILRDFRDNWDRIHEEMEKLRQRIREAQQEPTYGLDRRRQMPIFRQLRSTLFAEAALDDDQVGALVDLTQQLYNALERELQLTGFWESIPARNKLKDELQGILLSERFAGLPAIFQQREAIISRVMEIAKRQNDSILAAADRGDAEEEFRLPYPPLVVGGRDPYGSGSGSVQIFLATPEVLQRRDAMMRSLFAGGVLGIGSDFDLSGQPELELGGRGLWLAPAVPEGVQAKVAGLSIGRFTCPKRGAGAEAVPTLVFYDDSPAFVGFPSVINADDLESAKVVTLDLKRLLSTAGWGSLGMLPLNALVGLRGLLNETSALWVGLIGVALVVELARQVFVGLKVEYGPRYAGVLIALRDSACRTGLDDEQLRLNVDLLLRQEGVGEIQDAPFDRIIGTLQTDLRCVSKNTQWQWCLNRTIRFRA